MPGAASRRLALVGVFDCGDDRPQPDHARSPLSLPASAAGDEVLEWQAFSKSALTIDARPSADAGPATTVEFTVTHMLDDIPSEMHVWAALNYRTNIDVVTGDERIWRVAADGFDHAARAAWHGCLVEAQAGRVGRRATVTSARGPVDEREALAERWSVGCA